MRIWQESSFWQFCKNFISYVCFQNLFWEFGKNKTFDIFAGIWLAVFVAKKIPPQWLWEFFHVASLVLIRVGQLKNVHSNPILQQQEYVQIVQTISLSFKLNIFISEHFWTVAVTKAKEKEFTINPGPTINTCRWNMELLPLIILIGILLLISIWFHQSLFYTLIDINLTLSSEVC